MRIAHRPAHRPRLARYAAGALLLALVAAPAPAAQAQPQAAAGWQAVPPPTTAGLSSYVPFDASSAVARSSVQTSVTCLPCEYEHTLWTRRAGTWRGLPLPPNDASTDVLTGTAPDDVWALGRSVRGHFDQYHWNGSSWTDRSIPKFEVLAARSVARGEVWAVGNYREGVGDTRGAVARWNGSAWTLTKLGTPGHWTNLKAVHVGSANDVWAVGSTGDDTSRPYAAHYDGTSWREVALPPVSSGLSASANAVVARGGEVWIGGIDRNIWSDDGTGAPRAFALRREGTSWRVTYVPVLAPTGDEDTDRLSVQALAYHDGTLWAGLYADRAKDQGLARWNGSAWEPVAAPGTTRGSEVTALYPTADGTLWANGLVYPRAYLKGYAASLAPGAR
ncbi:hypothetical protein [Streptomyces sp. YU58]|uniref:hypothetical protein n=1 Tax=Streptomyces sp. SX92 TaxID=3158972 RepID=UPI0027B952D8|nr:hypothetical protein [Streptomyces coralus]WLW53491.1 hypothetical protein QU709_19880 [Streptomyces coralus]